MTDSEARVRFGTSSDVPLHDLRVAAHGGEREWRHARRRQVGIRSTVAERLHRSSILRSGLLPPGKAAFAPAPKASSTEWLPLRSLAARSRAASVTWRSRTAVSIMAELHEIERVLLGRPEGCRGGRISSMGDERPGPRRFD